MDSVSRPLCFFFFLFHLKPVAFAFNLHFSQSIFSSYRVASGAGRGQVEGLAYFLFDQRLWSVRVSLVELQGQTQTDAQGLIWLHCVCVCVFFSLLLDSDFSRVANKFQERCFKDVFVFHYQPGTLCFLSCLCVRMTSGSRISLKNTYFNDIW